MRKIGTLFLKEWRASLLAFAAIFAAVNYKLAIFGVSRFAGNDDPVLFLLGTLGYDEQVLMLFVPTIVIFWAGLRSFAPEWRQGTMVWMKTLPVGDGAIAGVKLATGITMIFVALFLAYALGFTLWIWAGGLHTGFNVRGLVGHAIKGLFLVTLWLVPSYLLGALVSSLVKRTWWALGAGIGVWLGLWSTIPLAFLALVATGAVPKDQAAHLMRFQYYYPVVSITLGVVGVAALVALTVHAHRRREIAR